MSLNAHHGAMPTNGLLAHLTALDTDDMPLSVEQRDEALRQYRIEAASQLLVEKECLKPSH